MPTIEEILSNYSRSGAPIKDLSRFKSVCDVIGNLEENLAFIHVAGTNGKGSVCAYITSALIADGVKVGTFTSPHLIDWNERITINNVPVSHSALAAALFVVHCLIANAKIEGCSQFELLTAAALLVFYEEGINYVVWEVGLGGLFDCTNVVTPLISVITSIGADHTEYLCDDLYKKNYIRDFYPEIAMQKAGIIKDGVPVIIAEPEHEEVREVFDLEAQKHKVRIDYVSVEKQAKVSNVSFSGNKFTFYGEKYSTKMGGSGQLENAALAVKALLFLGVRSPSIKKGLSAAYIPARMELVRSSPPFILDGGHNPQGVSVAAYLFNVKYYDKKRIIFVGCLISKMYDINLRVIFEYANLANIYFIYDFDENAVPIINAEEVVEEYRTSDEGKVIPVMLEYASLKDVPDIISQNPTAAVLVTGSLYLAGAIRNLINNGSISLK